MVHCQVLLFGGMVRCVFKIESGKAQFYQRVFSDDVDVPDVICEHIFGKPFPDAVRYLEYDNRGYLARYLEFWANENTGLRYQASNVVKATDGYGKTTTYWFSETGGFREKYTHTGNVVHEQTHRDDQPKRASGKPFQCCVNRSVGYGMKPFLPMPNN